VNQSTVFADILDATEQLDVETQAELLAILSRRLAERGRERVRETVEQAEREFAAGQCRVATPKELVQEALQ
jgi:ribose 1,5-bisphosphokinase PhnN